ncbi:hypothetical protein ACFL1E_07560 [Candidatus Omnitrophota bacterium]
MRGLLALYMMVCVFSLVGCETVHSAAKKTGEVAGETMETMGGLSEGGAEAYHGGETEEENPMGR